MNALECPHEWFVGLYDMIGDKEPSCYECRECGMQAWISPDDATQRSAPAQRAEEE